MTKIAVYTIAKNESENIRDWFNSCSEADFILLCDTGSEDHTISVAEAFKINVVSFPDSAFAFDKAKNFALSKIPEDIDFCISLDCDETLMPGWRTVIESANLDKNAVCLTTIINSDDTALTVGRIHGRHGFEWKNPIHEYVEHTSKKTQSLPAFAIYHKQKNKDRDYLPKIFEALESDPDNFRLMYNLAMDLALEHEQKEESILWLRRLLKIVDENDVEFISHIYRLLGEFDSEYSAYWLHKACEIAPFIRENWFEMSGHYFEKDWEWCLYASKKAINIAKPTKNYIDNFAWGAEPYVRAAISSVELGDIKEGLRYYTLALYTEPENAELKKAKEKIESLLKT